MRSPSGVFERRSIFRIVVPALAIPLLALAALLFVLRPFSMFLFSSGADASWMAVLAEAANRPARWGVDLAFTYGPASALVTRYYTDRYVPAVPLILTAVALTWALVMVRLAIAGADGRRDGSVLMVGAPLAAAALASQLIQDDDAFVYSLALAVFLLAVTRRPTDRVSATIAVLGGLGLGVEGLAKSSFGILAAALFVVSDLHALTARRTPLLVPALAAGFVAAFLAYGQHLGDLPAYVRMQGEVVAGYGAAMYIEPRSAEIAGFLAGALALGLAAVRAAGRGDRLAVALGMAAYVLVALKAGFVRADTHPQIAWGMLGLAGPPVAAGLLLRRSRRAAVALVVACLAVLLLVTPAALVVEQGSTPNVDAFAETAVLARDALVQEATAWLDIARDAPSFIADQLAIRAQAIAAVRAETPLPALAGTVDMIPSLQSAVLAAGLDYRPRPSFQSYGTYTAALIAANRRVYDGPSAPDWVLFGPETTDDRFPNMVEGALWPILLDRYRPVSRAGTLLVLRRRSERPPDILGPPDIRAVRLGEWFAVPPGPVFAAITVEPKLLGRLASALFRPPALHLRILCGDGSERTYRFIPALGREGFVLSPVVDDATDFARLALAEPPLRAGSEIREASIVDSKAARFFYESEIGLSFRRIAIPREDPAPELERLGDAHGPQNAPKSASSAASGAASARTSALQ